MARVTRRQALQALAKAISARGLKMAAPIIVFGSAPLQIFVDNDLLSGDVDVSAGKQIDDVKADEGKYVYCVVKTPEGREFGPIGIGEGGHRVYTVH